MKYFLISSFSRVFLFLLLSSFFLSGCISDDYEDCSTGVFLRFSYDHNSRFVDLFSSQVDDLTYFLYDSSTGVLVDSRKVSCLDLVGGSGLFVSLVPGSYDLVFWGNLNEAHYVCETSSLDDMRLSAVCDSGSGLLSSSLGSLFHGRCSVSVRQYQRVDESVSMIKNTNRVRVILQRFVNRSDISTLVDADDNNDLGFPYLAGISGCNGVYSSDNSCVATEPLHYTPAYTRLVNGVEADFTVLRLFEDDDLSLRVTRSEDSFLLHELSLVSELMKHPDINTNDDLDRYDDYVLTYSIDDTSALTLIRINDWDVTNIGGGL